MVPKGGFLTCLVCQVTSNDLWRLLIAASSQGIHGSVIQRCQSRNCMTLRERFRGHQNVHKAMESLR